MRSLAFPEFHVTSEPTVRYSSAGPTLPFIIVYRCDRCHRKSAISLDRNCPFGTSREPIQSCDSHSCNDAPLARANLTVEFSLLLPERPGFLVHVAGIMPDKRLCGRQATEESERADD